MEGIPSQSCFILPVPESRRYFFVVPFHGLHLVGTTESEIAGDPVQDPQATAGEKEELLGLTRRYFPGANPRILTTFAGIRPLAAGGGSTVTLSREHVFHKLRDGLFAVAGGKYTTHRVLARDYLCFILGKRKKEIPVLDLPYPGSPVDGEQATLRRLEELHAGPRIAWPRWLAIYGARAADLAAFIAADPARRKSLCGEPDLCAGEVLFSAEREYCRNAVDFFRRRTGFFFTPSAGLKALEEVERLLETPSDTRKQLPDGDYRAFLQHHGHRAARTED
jgi:glycerol-3-phosphate dehydrogenase